MAGSLHDKEYVLVPKYLKIDRVARSSLIVPLNMREEKECSVSHVNQSFLILIV
jgi:hypothetical protein